MGPPSQLHAVGVSHDGNGFPVGFLPAGGIRQHKGLTVQPATGRKPNIPPGQGGGVSIQHCLHQLGKLGKSRLPLFHFDMYRLSGSEDLFDIGWEDYLSRGGVCAVEWSEQAAGALPEDAILVDIARGEGENDRIITITGGETH